MMSDVLRGDRRAVLFNESLEKELANKVKTQSLQQLVYNEGLARLIRDTPLARAQCH